MSASRRTVMGLLVLLATLSTAVTGVQAQSQEPSPAGLWADFNHYVLIARPELAQAAGEALLNTVEDEQLLEIVESSEYSDYDKTFVTAGRIESLRDTARQLEQRIQQARIAVSRDAERIRADIQILDDGQRRNRNATERLAAAGQYAAPHFLEVLADPQQVELHPYVITAMTQVGRPLVAPLTTALPDVNPVLMGQLARVLSQIGYPQALAPMKQVLENPQLDPEARRIVQRAFDRLAETTNQPTHHTAADLYLALARAQYSAATEGRELPGFDAAEQKGILWHYADNTGLVPVPVPAVIFGDVLAMQSAERALALNPNLDAALSQYLMANLRRANRLPEGEVDLSYGNDRRSPEFYAMLAGPVRLHDVLDQALIDHDAALALDAINALALTAGTDALVNQDAARQPLLDALSYPDRRVRFHAARALANAKPSEAFEGSYRVAPVLAEAVRQEGVRYALVLSSDQATLNELLSRLGDLGYRAFGGLSLTDEEVRAQINNRPGVDLIVVSDSAGAVAQVFRDSAADYKLAATPVLAAVSSGAQYELRQILGETKRLGVTSLPIDPQALGSAVEVLTQAHGGAALGVEESEQTALSALQVLRDIALASEVYQIEDAQPALVQALGDERTIIVENAGKVLALVNNAHAQQALAAAAITASEEVQVSLLESLAESATYFGNMLDASQTDQLLLLVRNGEDGVAVAAARAHGALALPTSNAVQRILD